MTQEIYLENNLCFAFTGKRVDHGEVDALTFSKSIEALNNLFVEANRVLNPNDTSITVEITANFEEGSFQFWVKIKQGANYVSENLFGDRVRTKNAEIAAILGFLGALTFGSAQVSMNLIDFLKETNNDPVKIVKNIDAETLEIECNGKKIKVPMSVFMLQQDIPVRRNLEGFISPLCQKDIDSIEVRKNKKAVQKIEKKHLPAFRTPNINQIIKEEEYTETYSIARPDILVGNEWGLRNDKTKKRFTAKILDESFIDDVHSKKYEFASGDKLKVKMKETLLETKDGQKTLYEVLVVQEHLKM